MCLLTIYLSILGTLLFCWLSLGALLSSCWKSMRLPVFFAWSSLPIALAQTHVFADVANRSMLVAIYLDDRIVHHIL